MTELTIGIAADPKIKTIRDWLNANELNRTIAIQKGRSGLRTMRNLTTTPLTDQVDPSTSDSTADTPTPAGKISPSRREYLREYYRKNREKSRQYQREYNLRHKKRIAPTKLTFEEKLKLRSVTIHASDIMHAAPERAARIINQVVRGDRQMVPVARA